MQFPKTEYKRNQRRVWISILHEKLPFAVFNILNHEQILIMDQI